ncbi:DUF4124 domain-containing protein [Thioalkalicoccus limnaeus]|uniref:DUF4124 domain-containing protein n=1 Tax=Thioalkalicoccus limnaeus TaxID=120681 RepID=A0ABV4BFI6_9GAMM
MGYLIVSLLAILASPLAADVYRHVDEQGRVTFSDRAVPGSVLVESRGSGPPPAARPFDTVAPDEPTGDPGPFEAFEILEPADGDIVPHNEDPVAIRLLLIPSLMPEQRLQLRVNGQLVPGDLRETQTALQGLAPGSHRLQAVIRDGDDVIATTDPIVFHRRPGLDPTGPAP